MPAIWNRVWLLSNHRADWIVPRGTNAPAHRRTPLIVAYSTESTSAQPSQGWTASLAANTMIRPPGRTKGTASATHSSTGNVALDDATPNACLGSSSWRQRATSNKAAPPAILFAVERKAHRFARGSTKVVRQSGLSKANGTPGSPPPAPTSTTFAPVGAKRAKANESGRWSPANSSILRAPVKLTRAFHRNISAKNPAIPSTCEGVTATPQVLVWAEIASSTTESVTTAV
jgi:hypothetical protein